MLTVIVRGMFAHKLRLFLTTAAIALGVAFLSGTLILTDTMQTAFDRLFAKVSAGTDAVVRQESAFASGASGAHRPVPAGVLDAIHRVDGVRAAEGTVSGYALITDTKGKAVLTSGGAPTLGLSLPTDAALRGDVRVRSGHDPHGPTQVVIDARSATKHHIPIGAKINVLFHGPTRAFTVVGIATFGSEQDLGGATTAYFDLPTAQQLVGTPGAYDQITVAAVDGVSERVLVQRLRSVLPGGVEALTGAEVTKEFSDQVHDSLGFVTIMFSVFAGVALFVGSFIIWNAFSMIVSQRSREIALLRAVGSTRGQVMRSLLVEAVLLGLGASAIGLALGVGVAKLLTALMSAIGFELPSTSAQIEPRTVVVALLVGTLVTTLAALLPARRATKVLPIEALREAAPGTGGSLRRRAIVGSLLSGLGIVALAVGLFGGAGPGVVGIGVAGVLLGMTTLLPLGMRALAGAVGAPLRARGVPGDLARQNAMRNPRRTAATAAALTIGLTLVVTVSVLAASLKKSVGTALGDSTHADLFITRASIGAEGFSARVGAEVSGVDGVQTVSMTGFGEARFAGAGTTYTAIDPATADRVMDLQVSSGHTADLSTTAVMVRNDVAEAHHWHVGSTVRAEFASTGKHDLQITAIYDRHDGFVGSDYVLSRAAAALLDGKRLDTAGLVLVAPGANRDAVQDRISAALADHPDAKVVTQSQFERDTAGFIDQLLIFVSVMLLLAVVIALLGIVNTLALSVFERTRELGLLRAVGMTRNQVRAMVRWESVVISLIGAAIGALLGVAFGVVLVRALKDQGVSTTDVPVLQVVLYVAAAAVAGVLAAIGPARSAAKVDVLKAVVTD